MEQAQRWPTAGLHILAQFDDESIIVYQAYSRSIARHAIEFESFGGEFSYSRMSWIKPSFLWMMYRSGWGSKLGQEVVLSIRIQRAFFDSLLAAAVPSAWDRDLFPSKEEWKRAVDESAVRLQWDPDHDPFGRKLDRHAIQLGLRGEPLHQFGKREILEITDLSEFVRDQRARLDKDGVTALWTPVEQVYLPADPSSHCG